MPVLLKKVNIPNKLLQSKSTLLLEANSLMELISNLTLILYLIMTNIKSETVFLSFWQQVIQQDLS